MEKLSKKKENFIKLLNIVPILEIIAITVLFILILCFVVKNYYKQVEKNFEKNLYQSSYRKATQELNYLYSLIDFLYYKKEKALTRELVQNVDIGYSIVDSLYKQHVSLDIIKKTLENIRFFSDKSGYFFVYDMKGNVLSLPIKKSLEGKNLYNYQDVKGNYVIRNMINCLKSKDSCFLKWYYIYPKTRKMEEKIGLVRIYRPLNIFFGSAFYKTTINSEVINEIRKLFKKITQNVPYRVIIYDNEGNVIFSKIKKLEGKNIYNLKINGEYIVQNVIKNAPKNQIYVFKTTNIVNGHVLKRFFKYYPKLNIYLGVKVDETKLKEKILKNKEKINKIVNSLIVQFLTISLVFLVFVIIVNLFLIRLLKNLFLSYEKELIIQKERAEQSERAKAQFLANMSHEIRTPLNAILGFIKILQDKDLDKESKTYLSVVEKSGQNLLNIINDILDFSKLESGKMNIEKIEFNPKEEIESIQKLFTSIAKEKNILFEFNEQNLNWYIVTDPTRLKQVIANLLSNAIKFTPEGKKVILNVKYDENKEELFVEVIDEGIGIEKEKLNKIFEAFTQADNSTTRKYGGTGLGLSISYKLVKLLGGELKVESEVGKGSRFYFKVPAKKTKLISEEEKKENKKLFDEKFDNLHVLVVEDNPANQMFIKVILQKMGVKFDLAKDGVEALEKFKENKYDLILMDENMPRMNGIEATKRIREYEKEKNLTPTIIVALTANALAGDKERFLNAGMDYFISKPINIEKLKDILRKFK